MYSSVPSVCPAAVKRRTARRQALAGDDLGDAEVEHLDEVGLRSVLEVDVLGLDVAMDDALAVRLAERVGDAVHHARQPRRRQRAVLSQDRVQAAALQHLHRQVHDAFGRLIEVVDLHRVRRAQQRRRLRLALEAADDLRIARHLRVQDLERDLAVHLRLRRAIDRAEAAFADLLLDQIAIVEQLAGQVDVDGRRRQLRHRRRRRPLLRLRRHRLRHDRLHLDRARRHRRRVAHRRRHRAALVGHRRAIARRAATRRRRGRRRLGRHDRHAAALKQRLGARAHRRLRNDRARLLRPARPTKPRARLERVPTLDALHSSASFSSSSARSMRMPKL